MRIKNESAERRILDVIDAHAGGDVGRVVLDGVGNLPAGTVAERARSLRQRGDGLRRLLVRKSQGDPSQCINLVVPPSDPGTEHLVEKPALRLKTATPKPAYRAA